MPRTPLGTLQGFQYSKPVGGDREASNGWLPHRSCGNCSLPSVQRPAGTGTLENAEMAEGVHVIGLTAAWERSAEGGWLREFGVPTGLSGAHRLWLVIDDAAGPLAPRLNGRSLGEAADGGDGSQAWEVTGLLGRRNRLELAATTGGSQPPHVGRAALPSAYGEVRLKIEEPGSENNA